MKKILSIILSLVLCFALAGCGNSNTATDATETASDAFEVGICQLMVHDSLDAATKGFMDALEEKMTEAGKSVSFDLQVAGDANLCTTVVNTFTSKKVDLIMANATPALLAAATATLGSDIPVLGTSVTDYTDTFNGNIPANVSGTSDAVPFDEQAQMMIDTLKLVAGDKVGVIYCTNESNSVIQYEAVKALFEEAGVVVEAYTFSETTELQTVVTKAAGECKAIYVPSDNTVAQNDVVVGEICSAKNVPVFTSYGGAICYASLAIDYYELGRETGLMAAQVLLDGANTAEMEVKTLTPTVVYNEELCGLLGVEIPEN